MGVQVQPPLNMDKFLSVVTFLSLLMFICASYQIHYPRPHPSYAYSYQVEDVGAGVKYEAEQSRRSGHWEVQCFTPWVSQERQIYEVSYASDWPSCTQTPVEIIPMSTEWSCCNVILFCFFHPRINGDHNFS